MAQLEELKKQVEQLKTQRAIAQNKLDEALATLRDTFGVNDLAKAEEEYDAITKGVIPQLQLKRDNMLKKAEALLNGITTENQKTGAGTTRGIIGNRNAGGAKTGRRPVGIRRDN
jgi:hypothetical protein